jgi:hypothetical protein
MDTDKVSLSGVFRDLLLEPLRPLPLLLRRLPLLSTALSFVPQIDPAQVMLLPMLILLGIAVFVVVVLFLLSPASATSGRLLLFNAMAPQKEEPDCRCCFFPPPLLIFSAAATASIGEEQEPVGIPILNLVGREGERVAEIRGRCLKLCSVN